jgi:hypothetical protein
MAVALFVGQTVQRRVRESEESKIFDEMKAKCCKNKQTKHFFLRFQMSISIKPARKNIKQNQVPTKKISNLHATNHAQIHNKKIII